MFNLLWNQKCNWLLPYQQQKQQQQQQWKQLWTVWKTSCNRIIEEKYLIRKGLLKTIIVN